MLGLSTYLCRTYQPIASKGSSASMRRACSRFYATDGEVVYPGAVKKRKGLFDLFSKEPQLDPELVSLLRCPISKKPLRYDPKAQELIQDEEGIVYHVVDGVPILTPSAARSLHEYVDQNGGAKS